MNPPLVYDCIIFFNELDLLEVRLNELKDVVDKFVIVEASFTHSSNPKPFYFEENKDRFSKFLDQIIHVKIEELPYFPPQPRRRNTIHNRHEVEHYHRNYTWYGLVDCNDNDIIIIGDVDEIPTINSISEAKDILSINSDSVICFRQRHFNYFFNGTCIKDGHISPWYGQVATTYENLKKVGTDNVMDDNNCSPMVLRMGKEGRLKNSVTIDNAGWHFSYLGGIDEIIKKVGSYSHEEFDTPEFMNREVIENRIKNGQDVFGRSGYPSIQYVDLDKSFPEYVLRNKDKYKHLIFDGKL
jgi:beta-1,4-mannosyl-glycoprotein beta-1,4-N-acetylglucosaminyltransferase